MRQGLKTHFQTSDRAGSGVRPWAWASPGGMGAVHIASHPWAPPGGLGPVSFPSKPRVSAFLTCAERTAKSWNLRSRFWKRQESKMGHKGKQPDAALPAWAPGSHAVLASWPFLRVSVLMKGHLLLGFSSILPRWLKLDSFRLLLNPRQINCVTRSLFWGAMVKKNFRPHPNPASKAD